MLKCCRLQQAETELNEATTAPAKASSGPRNDAPRTKQPVQPPVRIAAYSPSRVQPSSKPVRAAVKLPGPPAGLMHRKSSVSSSLSGSSTVSGSAQGRPPASSKLSRPIPAEPLRSQVSILPMVPSLLILLHSSSHPTPTPIIASYSNTLHCIIFLHASLLLLLHSSVSHCHCSHNATFAADFRRKDRHRKHVAFPSDALYSAPWTDRHIHQADACACCADSQSAFEVPCGGSCQA